MALEKTDAGVPAQDSVIVARGAEALGFFEEVKGFHEPVVDVVRRAGAAGAIAGLGAALPGDSGVVGAIVGRFEGGDGLDGARERGGVVRDLVGESKDEADAGVAIGGVDNEDVAADAFGLRRLVEKAVTLGPGECAPGCFQWRWA